MIKHIDSYTRIALKDTVHIFTGVLLYSFTGVLFHGQGAETCFFGELWTFSRFRRKIDEVHLSQKLMGHMNLHTAWIQELASEILLKLQEHLIAEHGATKVNVIRVAKKARIRH